MTTGFDQIGQDPKLQMHWVYRLFAALIDVVLVFVPIYIIMLILSLTQGLHWFMFGVIMGFFWMCYSAVFEETKGATVGKQLFGLKVVSLDGRIQTYQAMMRNLTKIFGAFLLIDVLLGLVVDTADARQKYSDRVARTTVVSERNP
ncbi:MAG: RDD family protein [Thermoplasmata archaeon]